MKNPLVNSRLKKHPYFKSPVNEIPLKKSHRNTLNTKLSREPFQLNMNSNFDAMRKSENDETKIQMLLNKIL